MFNDNLKISLVIPAYNEEKYLGDCLKHAIANSGGRFAEIVVIDNASTDRTREVGESFPGVRVVREEQKGLTKARQRGYQEAKGDVLAYIDADTRMPAGWYDQVFREFVKNDKLACLSGPYVYYDFSMWQQLITKLYWYVLALPFYYSVGYMTVGGNFAIRRTVLDQMAGFDTSISFYGEDTNIARRASQFGQVLFRPSLVMYTSARRLTGQGLFKTGFIYGTNFLSEVFLKKPITTDYQDIR